jgi:hypothetical protein
VLGVLFHASRGPFYSPKTVRSRWSSIWKSIVAFYPWAHRTVRCPTGQRTMRDFLPFLAKPTVAAKALVPHRTVRCGLVIIGAAGSPDCPVCTVWCTPDCPMNYSRDALSFSRERPVRRGSQPHRTRVDPEFFYDPDQIY